MTFYFCSIHFLVSLVSVFTVVIAKYEEILQEAGPVVLANVLYRHGQRTPEHSYPNDPYKNDSFWPIGWGQLTNTGKLQHYMLGQWLGSRYSHLIPKGRYSPNVIHVQSTDMDRTLMSALSNLAGMFPPTNDESWCQIPWQPIPVHTIPRSLDKLLYMNYPCPKYKEEYEAFLNSKEMKDYNAQHKELYDYLSTHSGNLVNDPDKAAYFYSTFLIQTLHNYTLPDWAKSVYPEKLYPVAGYSFTMQAHNKKLQRLKIGPLLKEMIHHMKQKESNTLVPEIPLWVYSGHDTTVSNLLNGLGVFDPLPPPFIATVLVELRKSLQGDYSVVVFYKNTTADPVLLTVPGCTPACPLGKFASLLQDIIPADWDSECHSHQLFDLTSGEPYNSIAIFAMVTSTLLVFLCLTSMSLYWHKQKPHHFYKKLESL